MSDPQSLHNSSPAPSISEAQSPPGRSPIPGWLRAWWPALLWACLIFTFSTDYFSSDHTASVLLPLVHWLFPHLSPHQLRWVHHLIRKSAHFTEYFIFCVLLFRGFRGHRTGWRWTWAFSAWFTAAAYSCLDEIHQAFVASRGASPYDSLLDSIGALVAFAALFLWFRLRSSKMSAAPDAPLPRG